MINLRRKVIVPLAALVAIAAATAVLWPRSEVMYARMPVGLYPSSVPEELASTGGVSAGERVLVLERRPPWIRLKADRAEGWLPEWYLADKADQMLPKLEEYRRVVKDPCHVYLYPDDSAPAVRELEVGKVVTIRAESGDWRYVDIIVFDIPAVMRGWMKTQHLAANGEAAPKEGRIPVGTTVYHGELTAPDPRQLPPEVVSYEMVISISFERGDMALVTAAGGWDGWVAKRDILFDLAGK